MPCYISSSVGNIDLEEVFAIELVGDEDAKAFPYELQGLRPVLPDGDDGEAVCLFVAYQHLCLDTILLQGFHQSVGSNRGPSDSFRCVDDKYSHISKSCAKLRLFSSNFVC